MSAGQQFVGNASAIVESLRSVDGNIKSSVAASTTGAVAAVVRQPRASSAPRREEARAVDRRFSSDVVVTSTKHVAKPWKQERAAIERRVHSQTGEQGGELRLTHERLQQYAAAHARLTAPARPGPRSTAGSTLLRKITNLAALVPSLPQPQQLGPASPTGAVAAAAAVVRTVSSAPVLSPAALAGARLAVTTPGIPLPGMGAPSGPRPTSAQRPLSPRQLLQRLISFPQGHMAQPLQQQQQRQQGAPPPDRAFGPRAADYPARHASPRPALLASYSSGASNGNGNGADYSWQPPQHAPHPPNNAKQRLNDPRVMSGRGGGAAALHTNIWMAQQQQQQHTQQSIPDSPLSSPAGLRPGQGQDYHGQGHGQHDWEVLHSPGWGESAAAAAATGQGGARDAMLSSPSGSPRSRSPTPLLPSPHPQPHPQPQPLQHPQPHGNDLLPALLLLPTTPQTTQQPQQTPQLQTAAHADGCTQLNQDANTTSPHHHPHHHHPHHQQHQQHQQQRPPSPQDRRLRPWTPGPRRRPQSSGPSASSPTRWPGAQQQQHQPQGLLAGGKPGAGNDVVVVGLRDVPPSQLPFARAVVQPEGAGGGPRFEGGLVRAGGGGGGGGSSDDGTNASWWHGGYGACSEASYPLTAVTDRNAVGRGEDDMTPSEAAMWLSRMAELEAEVMEEREFRRKYEEEIRMLAAAATAGGRGGRPSGGGPMLWQTTAGRVVSGARAAAAAVMRHKSGLPP